MNAKDEVRKIVADALQDAKDSLGSVHLTYGQGPYGPEVSEIVAQYKADIERLSACLEWVKSHGRTDE